MLGTRADLSETPVVVMDMETTGIFPGGHDRVIEIALLRFDPRTRRVEDEYETLINPKRDVGRADIHGIAAGDLLQAPEFGEVAGDIAHRLNGAIAAGHNVRFDIGFLRAEYARLGATLPEFPSLCTLHLAHRCEKAPRRNLAACCASAGIRHDDPHTALGDAKACLALLRHYLDRLQGCRLGDLGCDCDQIPGDGWITARPSGRAVRRDQAAKLRAAERGYLATLIAHLPGVEGSSLREAAYLCLLDHVLEDRALTPPEANALFSAAKEWGMSQNDVHGAHQAYVWALARQARADGLVTDLELRDLTGVCDLLAVDAPDLRELLQGAPGAQTAQPIRPSTAPFSGKSVCFTGELLGKIDGERIGRDAAEALARGAGLVVHGTVTRRLDILVVADPDSQSGKARKAREYGTRIMAEAAFWAALGVKAE